MAITEHASGTRATGTPPESQFAPLGSSGDTASGIFVLMVDTSNMQRGDQIEIQLTAKVISSGSEVTVWETTLANQQDEPLFVSPTHLLLHGWTYQLRQTLGVSRNFNWSIRRVA